VTFVGVYYLKKCVLDYCVWPVVFSPSGSRSCPDIPAAVITTFHMRLRADHKKRCSCVAAFSIALAVVAMAAVSRGNGEGDAKLIAK